MISLHRKPGKCAGCAARATRVVADADGSPLPLCDSCPDPLEIAKRAAKVREKWDEREHYCRHFQTCRAYAMKRVEVTYDQPVAVTPWSKFHLSE